MASKKTAKESNVEVAITKAAAPPAKAPKIDPLKQAIMNRLNEGLKGETAILEVLPVKVGAKDLSKVSITDLLITELEKRTKDLKQPTLEDEAGYNEVKKWRLVAKKLRTTSVNFTKAGREDAAKEVAAWLKEENDIKKRIKDNTEDRLEGFEDEWERLKRADDEAKLNARNERYTKRLLELTRLVKEATKLDLTLDQDTGMFILNGAAVERLALEEADDDIYATILESFTVEANKIKLANEASEAEAAKKLIGQTRDLREGLLKLVNARATDDVDLGTITEREWDSIYTSAKDAFDDLAKKETERLAKEKSDRVEARVDVLREIGFVRDGKLVSYITNGIRHLSYNEDKISELDDLDFKALYGNLSNLVVEIDQKETERLERLQADRDEKTRLDTIGETRTKLLATIGFTTKEDLREMPEDQWNDRYGKAQALFSQRAATLEAEELAKKGDKVQWNHFVEVLGRLPIPTAKNAIYKAKIEEAIRLINIIKTL